MLRKRVAVLLAAVMMVGVMGVAPAMAIPAGGFNPDNNGNKAEDGLDKNQGGGQEKIKHPGGAHAGGAQHGGGDQHGGGSG